MSDKPDLGSEQWEFPNATELDIPAVTKLWYELDTEATKANKRAALLKTRRQAIRDLAIEVVKQSGQTSGTAEVEPGRELRITPYAWEVFSIKDEAAFKDWAADESEAYYDAEPRLREGIFQDSMRRLSNDGEPLPPGVVRWEDVRISRTAVPKRKMPGTRKPQD